MDIKIKEEPLPSTSKEDFIEIELDDVPILNEIDGIGEITEIEMIELNSESSGDDEEEDDQLSSEKDSAIQDQEKALTNKYLNGELTFCEYAAFMEPEDNSNENQENSSSNASKEVDLFVKEVASTSKSTKKRSRRGKALPPVLQGLLGHANCRYVNGDHENALKMCMEIIRQVPTAAEPFQTLAHFYEDLGCDEKFLQFALIAAHLSPNDPDQWVRLASMSQNRGNTKQAITCYTKAIEADPTHIGLHLERASLLEQIGERKNSLKAYIRLITILDSTQGDLIFHLAKMVAKKCHQAGEVPRAYEVMSMAFNKSPAFIQSEDVNLILELLMYLKFYNRGVKIFQDHTRVEIETKNNENDEIVKIISYKIPDDLAVDLLAKFLVLLIHLKSFHLLNDLINLLFRKGDPELTGDLYLDVAEALMSENKHDDALRLLKPLVNGKNYYLPAVWLRQAECLHACGHHEEAAEAYAIVVKMAPQYLEARLVLAHLYSNLGKSEEALRVLTQDENTEILEPGLLYQRTQLLKIAGESKIEDFLAVGQLLLSRHCVNIRSQEEVQILIRLRRSDRQKEQLKELRVNRGEPDLDPNAPDFGDTNRQPSYQDEWDLLQDLCKACIESGQIARFQRLAFSALGSRVFMGVKEIIPKIEFLCLLSCFYNDDYYNGYNFARDLLIKKRKSPRIWNLFNLIIHRAEDVRHNRFIMRCLSRESSNVNFMLLHANNCLIAGTYKYALNEYANAYRLLPDDPMLPFLLGVTLTQMACQKFTLQKNAIVTQAIGFFSKYQQARCPLGQQEVYYNLARAHHQYGLLPQAIHYYKQVLNIDCPLGSDFDLKKEASFNLYNIYKTSGSIHLARYYIDTYLEI